MGVEMKEARQDQGHVPGGEVPRMNDDNEGEFHRLEEVTNLQNKRDARIAALEEVLLDALSACHGVYDAEQLGDYMQGWSEKAEQVLKEKA